ncbi:nuclear transport factor 2 family protein [Kribbella sp. NPDC051770]|uniref:nuclear transport factor 2 family protein n=1 Tax=Kribbella sp. NPDC051770 TaxID=3155413 RepID=UPI003436E266
MSRSTDHVEAFNTAVTTGDWDTFATRFAADATMTFTNVPAGPFHGRAAIAEAYRTNPPTETMRLLDDTRFAWASGPTGTMHLTWTPTGHVQSLTITFD